MKHILSIIFAVLISSINIAAVDDPTVGKLKPADYAKFVGASKGKVLVVNFWATWCGPCVAEFPEFVAIDTNYRDKNVKVVGITADEPDDVPTKVIPFIKEQKVKFDILLQDSDDPQDMIDAVAKDDWLSGALPATFVYDKQGKLVYKKIGVMDRKELIDAIEKALK